MDRRYSLVLPDLRSLLSFRVSSVFADEEVTIGERVVEGRIIDRGRKAKGARKAGPGNA